MTVTKYNLLKTISDAFAKANIELLILHGVNGEKIGRDVDVFIKKEDWRKTIPIVKEIASSHTLKVSYTNSIFGLRFLFFIEDSDECGFFELHIVRSLKWFWLNPPKESSCLNVHKRLILPLLSKDIKKTERELSNFPLTESETENLSSFFSSLHLCKNLQQSFFDLIKESKVSQASTLLRHSILKKTIFHPLRVISFLITKLIKPYGY